VVAEPHHQALLVLVVLVVVVRVQLQVMLLLEPQTLVAVAAVLVRMPTLGVLAALELLSYLILILNPTQVEL
tara:strand:+ start:21 stop:236 length:216 start_codon:yes stop_codon:yes gene_type:complete